jgi:two-component system response regulator AtoC
MMQNRNILLAEDNTRERSFLFKALESWGYRVTTANDGTDAEKKFRNDTFGLVITSYEISGLDSIKLFQIVRSEDELARVLFLSSRASVEDAVRMMKGGAFDFLIKPIDLEQIRHLVKMAFNENGDKQSPGIQESRSVKIVTQDAAMLRLLDLAKQVADSSASVFIQGESGTGKELFARFIHENSSRRNRPFVAVNCSALPESLLESELFGHEKGAFTGAVSRKPGKFELANGGTILLDEITEMQFHLQPKLLRVLQEHEIDRVGGYRPIGLDVRVIATTNRDIKDAIGKGDFREDLFYRLNVIPLKIPPLRERKNDVLLLAQHFIEKYNKIDGRSVKSMTNEAINKLMNLTFNGNVRELENLIQRAVLLSDGVTVQRVNLMLEENRSKDERLDGSELDVPHEYINGPLREVEKRLIFHTLDKTNGNRTHAAKILGITVRTLRNKLNEYKEKME